MHSYCIHGVWDIGTVVGVSKERAFIINKVVRLCFVGRGAYTLQVAERLSFLRIIAPAMIFLVVGTEVVDILVVVEAVARHLDFRVGGWW